MKIAPTLTALLSDRKQFVEDIRQGLHLRTTIVALLLASLLLFAVYGAIVGAAHSAPQALASAAKLPALYLLTSLICFPTLYVFNVFFGSKLGLGEHLALMLSSLGIIALLMVSFAPITFFFLITSDSYPFYKLLNVAIFAVTGVIGVVFFYRSMVKITAQQDADNRDVRLQLLLLWLVLFAFVGTQLGWTIRPVFGDPGLPFILFADPRGNIYADIVTSALQVFGMR
jgi:uncharacterized membrane protein (UPF0136 family)